MFESVLIANRGEIAVRIAKTLRKMGIRSVVVASIPDRRSLAVRTADDWMLLEGYSAAESYLDVEAVIAEAKEKGCQAIHPGYGFLAERPDFAERCAAEGITFVGPPSAVLRGMGDKSAARKLAVANGVRVVPGWDGEDDQDTLAREADRIGYPVMLKARGGGGGRGMREVFAPGELPDAIESARREALAAFGDGGLLLEKLVTEAHHVEVQVLGDSHGNVIHLGERDCSVQRRHQKLIEESPSPVVDDALRAELAGAALKLARAVNYVNAGTFEFLVGAPGADGRRPFYFLEVNPRLQVEHPVTEMVTGLDIVEMQLRIAAGEPLSMRQEDVKFEGHAIEFRVNAEDPWDEFKPSSGRIECQLMFAHHESMRLEQGYEHGDTVPANYDSLVAKVLVHCSDRAEAAAELANIAGPLLPYQHPRTNSALGRALLSHPDFIAGKADVAWMESNLEELLGAMGAPGEAWDAVIGALRSGRPGESESVFGEGGWIGPGEAQVWLTDGVRTLPVSGVATRLLQRPFADLYAWESKNGYTVFHDGSDWLSAGNDQHSWDFRIVPPPPLPRRAAAASAGATAITAPLAGTIAAVRVAEGDSVAAGQPLVMLEAMKMEHRIVATADGTVRAVHVRQGDVVSEGDILVEVA